MDSVSGVILIATSDPLTKLLSLITGTEYMTVGFYNSSAINGCSVINLTLFNSWEKSTPKWVELFYNYDHELTLDKVLAFPLVTSVMIYPVKKELDYKFRLYSTKIMSQEELNHEKISYSWLFCYSTKFKFPHGEYKINTGFDIVNHLIQCLDGNTSKPLGTMDICIPNQLLSPQIKYSINKSESLETSEINGFFKEEIDMFVFSFLELFNGNAEFQRNMVEMKKGQRLIDYIRIENGLFDDIKKGVISEDRLFEINKVRNECNERLVTKDDYYNDKREEIANELLLMGDFITNIIEGIKTDQTVVIPLYKFLHHYNVMCQNLGIKQIDELDFQNANAIIVSKDDDLSLRVNDKILALSCNNLKVYTKEQLKEFLKSINEICFFDSKYLYLQNKIIEEISTRI
jgi:hypothetical protein